MRADMCDMGPRCDLCNLYVHACDCDRNVTMTLREYRQGLAARERIAQETADAQINFALDQRDQAEATAARLREAVMWALGERDEFPPRPEQAGAYWWRTELRRRALEGGSEQRFDADLTAIAELSRASKPSGDGRGVGGGGAC